MKRTREKPKNTMKNKFLSNTFWILGGQIVKILISFVISMLTARYLGPSNYGVINYVGSYIAFFTSLVGLGLNGVIIYELGNHRDEEGEILGTDSTKNKYNFILRENRKLLTLCIFVCFVAFGLYSLRQPSWAESYPYTFFGMQIKSFKVNYIIKK